LNFSYKKSDQFSGSGIGGKGRQGTVAGIEQNRQPAMDYVRQQMVRQQMDSATHTLLRFQAVNRVFYIQLTNNRVT